MCVCVCVCVCGRLGMEMCVWWEEGRGGDVCVVGGG